MYTSPVQLVFAKVKLPVTRSVKGAAGRNRAASGPEATFVDSTHSRLRDSPILLCQGECFLYISGFYITNTVTDSPRVSISVRKVANSKAIWLPSLVFTAPEEHFYRPATSKVLVTLLPSACLPMPSDANLAFAWTVSVASVPPGVPLSRIGTVAFRAQTRDLAVSPHTLSVGYTYELSLTLTGTSNTAFVGDSSSRRLLALTQGSTSASLLRSVVASSLSADIVGSDREFHMDLPALVLDASPTFDPDMGVEDKSAFNVQWGCSAEPLYTSNAAYSIVTGPMTLAPAVANKLVLSIPAAQLQVNAVYNCTAF